MNAMDRDAMDRDAMDWGAMDWDAMDTAQRAAALQRPTRDAGAEVRSTVAQILDEVREGGDEALRRITARIEGVDLADLRVGQAVIDDAAAQLTPELRAAIDEAAVRIGDFHRAGMTTEYGVDTAPGVRCERVLRPIGRVGLYVPAGSAPLPSTALMLGIPAQLAGCLEVVLCTPARPDGTPDPAVLYAAARCGIRTVHTLGGAQAVAAMAFGTESIGACDKIFGPGNAWVTEAKRQTSTSEGGPGIDLPAGPSEVVVIADAGADPEFVAADLLSQAEHGPDSQVLLLSDDDTVITAVARALDAQLDALPRADTARKALASSRLIRTGTLQQAFDVSNRYAPEHLILALRDARDWLPQVRAAGSVFLGDWSPETLGDYCSGTNHVLPTGGAARFTGGVNVASFQLAITVQEVTRDGLAGVGPCAMELAAAEGLEAHRRAVARRVGGGSS